MIKLRNITLCLSPTGLVNPVTAVLQWGVKDHSNLMWRSAKKLSPWKHVISLFRGLSPVFVKCIFFSAGERGCRGKNLWKSNCPRTLTLSGASITTIGRSKLSRKSMGTLRCGHIELYFLYFHCIDLQFTCLASPKNRQLARSFLKIELFVRSTSTVGRTWN